MLMRGLSTITWAAYHGYLDILKKLAIKGYDLTKNDNLALKSASLYGHLNVIEFLVEQGADLSVGGDILMKVSAERSHLDVLKYLVSKDIDILAYNNYALRHAVKNGRLDIIEYLVSIGARGLDEMLFQASGRGYFSIVKYLVSLGVNIDCDEGIAVKMASYYGYIEIVKYLVSCGADIHKYSPMEFAIAGKRHHVIKYLVSQGLFDDSLNPYDYINLLGDKHVKYILNGPYSSDLQIVRIANRRSMGELMNEWHDILVITR